MTAQTDRRTRRREADADRTAAAPAGPTAPRGRAEADLPTAGAAHDGPATAARRSSGGAEQPGRRPLYARVLRLRHLRLRGWQRLLLSDGALLLSVLLVLADLATAWTLLVLPLAVAAVVKAHDVAAGLLAAQTPTAPVPQDRRRRDERED